MQRRFEFEQDALVFSQLWEEESQKLMQRIDKAVGMYPRVQISNERLYDIAAYCLDVGVDGHRGDIIILKAAKALAAYHGRKDVQPEDIQAAAELALPHRIRRQPLQNIVTDVEGLRRERQAANG
jgi:magnesium chelatase subunit I